MSRSRNLVSAAVAVACVAAIGAGVYFYRARHAIPEIAPTPALLAELPADAPAAAYIDVTALRALKDSPLASLLGLASSGPDEDREYADFVRGTGFDYSRDLDHAALAFWPAPAQPPEPPANNPKSKSKSKTSETSASNDVLVIADGRFDQARIQAYALRSGTVATVGKQSLYRIPGDPPVSFEFLSAIRVVIASGSIAGAHLLAANSTGIDASLQPLVDRVSGAPFFAVARGDFVPQSVYASIGQPEMAKAIQGFALAGRPNSDSLDLALDARCDSMTNALQISTLLSGLRLIGSMAMSDPKTKSQLTKDQSALVRALLGQMQISQQGNWVRISLAVSPETLQAATKH